MFVNRQVNMTTHKLAMPIDITLLPSLHDTFQEPYCIMFRYVNKSHIFWKLSLRVVYKQQSHTLCCQSQIASHSTDPV